MRTAAVALFAGLSAAQSLNIPTRVGTVTALPAAETIKAGETKNYGNREYDRGVSCAAQLDVGIAEPVFVLENGATIEDVIIGPNAVEGIHCRGSCTITRVWFRDVCEDAISARGNGDVLITGGGAQNAADKIVQHEGKGTVTIRDYTVANVGKVYRSCGNCSNNSSRGPRHVVIENLTANGVKTNIVGINDNFGDTATISGSCGTVTGDICQQYKGVAGPSSESPKNSGKGSCKGDQGKLAKGALPAC